MTMSDYKFTTDWFHWAPEVWQQIGKQMPSRKRFLEIGSYEGRSTVWTVEHMLEAGGEIVCIDTWEGGEEHTAQGRDMGQVETNFDHNVKLAIKKFPERTITKWKKSSLLGLAALINEKDPKQFDFIYIDGSHQAPDVITDTCLAWPLLKAGGVMVFDDYGWGEPLPPTHKPKMAIDAFVKIYQERIHLIYNGYQLIIQKIKD
jgi:predicted O-methyltransferase YrrM